MLRSFLIVLLLLNGLSACERDPENPWAERSSQTKGADRAETPKPASPSSAALKNPQQAGKSGQTRQNSDEDKDAEPADVDGTWRTVFSGAVDSAGKSAGSTVILKLKQDGDAVEGVYLSPAGAATVAPGMLKGRLLGTKLRGKWRDKSGANGPFELVFNAKASSFSGYWQSSNLKGDWVGTKLVQAPGLYVSGTWNSLFSGGVDREGKSAGSAVILRLKQDKGAVKGVYTSAPGAAKVAPGAVLGRLEGRTLKGSWRDKSGAKGPFELVFNKQASSFRGYWRSQELRGDWVGTKAQ